VTGDPGLARVEVGGRGGAGILADEQTVITCAHVVRDLASGPPPGPVAIALTFFHPELATTGTVEPEGWFASPDLAVVRLATPVTDRTPPPLVAPHDLAGLRLTLRGFPAGYLAGDAVVAYATEPGGETADWWVVEAEPGAPGGTAQRGFSGGPAWSDTVGGVVGMTVAADRQGRRTAFVIPVSRLVEAYPPLALRVAPWYDDADVVSRLRDTVRSSESRWGAEDPRTIGARFGLGLCLLRRRTDLDEAESLLTTSLAARRPGAGGTAGDGGSPVRLIGAHMALAELYGCRLREVEAWEHLRAAERLGADLLAEGDPRRLHLDLGVADLLVRRGDLGEAADRIGRAHAAAVRQGRALELIAALSARAVLDAMFDVEQADGAARDAFRLSREVLPAGDPGAARLAHLVAGIHLQQGDVEAARRLVEEALATSQAALGSSHPDVAEGHRLTSVVAVNAGEVEEAGAAAARGLSIASRFYGDGHAGTAPYLLQAAFVRKVDGHPHQARELADAAVAGLDATLAPDDLRVAQALGFRADLGYTLGDPAAGDADARRSLAIAESRLAASPRYLIGFLLANAHTHLLAGRPREAEAAIDRAGALLAAQPSSPDWLTGGLAVTQGRALAGQGRFQDARPALAKAVRTFESTRGTQRALLGEALMSLAAVCQACGDLGAAAEYDRRGRTILAGMPAGARPPGLRLPRGPGSPPPTAADLLARGLDWWSKRRRA
jgi:Trypsin-like peptidase domain/Tetratricopeptide repeat